MPKLRKLCPDLDARKDVQKDIRLQSAEYELRQHDIAVKLNLSDSRTSLLMNNLDKLTAERIRKLVRMLSLDPVKLLRWLGYTDGQIKMINKENRT